MGNYVMDYGLGVLRIAVTSRLLICIRSTTTIRDITTASAGRHSRKTIARTTIGNIIRITVRSSIYCES